MPPSSRPPRRHLVLDFDGTCTQIPAIAEEYLERYRRGFAAKVGPLDQNGWADALAHVRAASPKAGWTLGGPLLSAPAAADPYILAYEAACGILRRRRSEEPADSDQPPLPETPPATVHHEAYEAPIAPWREDARETFLKMIDGGFQLHFVSNSDSKFIEGRLDALIDKGHPARAHIVVESNAGKFRVCDLPPVDPPLAGDAKFHALPEAAEDLPSSPGRPIYLRRGDYFRALQQTLGADLEALESTVVCGDIWEMDLAMPLALGARVHLLDRAAPFDTYPFEREAAASAGERAKSSVELSGLLAWL